MYETFEHTADLGLRVCAADLQTLFSEAGRGLCSIFVDNPEDVRPLRELTIQVEGDPQQRDYLLFDWLSELLYRFETEQLLLSDFDVALNEKGLIATARGERADPQRHRLAHEVKAITYHLLQVKETPQGWQAQLIVDI